MALTRIVNWNVEWRKPNSAKADIILQRLFSYDPDIVCITEGHLGFLPDAGHVVTSEADYGYDAVPSSRRKVILWSKAPWSQVDRHGDEHMPSGRYVAAQTATPIGPLYCHGVCVPWADAHVRTGRKDRKKWQDHEAYLEGLHRLRSHGHRRREVVIGDYNQRVPPQYQPERAFVILRRALQGLEIGTAGVANEAGKPAIDHLAHSKELIVTQREVISHIADDGRRLSDHFGVCVALQEREAA